MRVALPLLVGTLLLVACSEKAADPPRDPGRVVLYTGYEDAEAVAARVAGFTEATGIVVRVKSGEPGLIVDAVINNNGTPPADLLLSPDIFGIWRAAENGGLRALQSGRIQSGLAARFRDPDNLWFATAVDPVSIVFDAGAGDLSPMQSYEQLADEGMAGKLCLASSSLAPGRVLISMLIDKLDVRPTERVIRGMIRNLAQPVVDTEQALLEAIDSNACVVGIVSMAAARRYVESHGDTVVTFGPVQRAYFNIEGAGVARHARNPEAAQQLLEWLVENGNVADASLEALSDRNVGIAGWRGEDARLLAERTSYP